MPRKIHMQDQVGHNKVEEIMSHDYVNFQTASKTYIRNYIANIITSQRELITMTTNGV